MAVKAAMRMDLKTDPVGRLLLKMMNIWTDGFDSMIAKRLEIAVDFGKRARFF